MAIDKSPLRFTRWMPFQPNFNGRSAASLCSRDKCDSSEWKDESIYDDANVICSLKMPGKIETLPESIKKLFINVLC